MWWINKLNIRNGFYLNRYSIPTPGKMMIVKLRYYEKGICKLADYTVQIIEVPPEKTTATVRQKNKIKWMLKLRVAFLYGLNDKIGEVHQLE